MRRDIALISNPSPCPLNQMVEPGRPTLSTGNLNICDCPQRLNELARLTKAMDDFQMSI